jgi:hypothetical protein
VLFFVVAISGGEKRLKDFKKWVRVQQSIQSRSMKSEGKKLLQNVIFIKYIGPMHSSYIGVYFEELAIGHILLIS